MNDAVVVDRLWLLYLTEELHKRNLPIMKPMRISPHNHGKYSPTDVNDYDQHDSVPVSRHDLDVALSSLPEHISERFLKSLHHVQPNSASLSVLALDEYFTASHTRNALMMGAHLHTTYVWAPGSPRSARVFSWMGLRMYMIRTSVHTLPTVTILINAISIKLHDSICTAFTGLEAC
ncbi:hypothetical protein CEUSTIGMA_g4409.t1 [Chlamydomonas eustigma]|uniref:Uncharacterized protein n=1 Tax=Chlamydomonas eustigma TaxID=1157962 RepID=A0A250X243_9CHLO|nr:hypothetical protein CEUSTIGMA_g4409.t1 [Chlamydomonas eustigma]|eukprot:GAX76962.1 hypothetical protein CEUSTIGMA_g4409.t1 [Chlamydomonas eustigma]